MYLRKCRKTVLGRDYVYWQLVESCRTERGPRQRVVAYLSDLDEPDRRGITDAARGESGEHQPTLEGEETAPTWVEIDPTGVRVERVRDFGAYWLGLHLVETLGLVAFLETVVDRGREEVPWSAMALVLISTSFEGACPDNPGARFGYSRAKRSDCKQVLIARVVSREGMPLGYEQFAGNRADSSTVIVIIEKIERQDGKAERIWVMDRGMISQQTLPFLQAAGRQSIVGTPRRQLRQCAKELADDTGWETIQDGLSVKLIASTEIGESFILCRSGARGAKEQAMHARFAARIETGLEKLVAACGRTRKVLSATAERRIGALLTQNSRAKRRFQVTVGTRPDGGRDRRVEEAGESESVGGAERWLRRPVDQRHRERRRSVADLQPIDRGGGGVPHSER